MTVIYDIFLKGMKRKKQWVLGKQAETSKQHTYVQIPTVFATFFRSSYTVQFKRQK